jgi:histidinol-phosphate/aromatic aminotransferase/cobyric acid decarboxylase-like protein
VAKYHPDALEAKAMDAYEIEMNGILGKMVGARVALAALSPSVHAALSDKIEEFYDLDRAAGNASKRFTRSAEEGRKAWAKLYEESERFDDEFLALVVRLAPQLEKT